MSVTAVVLSRRPYAIAWPGLEVLVHCSSFSDMRGFLIARFAALRRVRTERFFFLDDDDTLPADYLDVLEECDRTGAALAYTDELVSTIGGDERLRSAAWSRDLHLAKPLLVHHLAVYRTAAARAAIAQIPVGHFNPDYLLPFEVARRSGAAYVPRIGYVWRKTPGGMHTWPEATMSQTRSQILLRER